MEIGRVNGFARPGNAESFSIALLYNFLLATNNYGGIIIMELCIISRAIKHILTAIYFPNRKTFHKGRLLYPIL